MNERMRTCCFAVAGNRFIIRQQVVFVFGIFVSAACEYVGHRSTLRHKESCCPPSPPPSPPSSPFLPNSPRIRSKSHQSSDFRQKAGTMKGFSLISCFCFLAKSLNQQSAEQQSIVGDEAGSAARAHVERRASAASLVSNPLKSIRS